MKIALLGYGKMGKMVEECAMIDRHTLTSIENADVCIDFSHPDCVLEHIDQACHLKKNIVVGTTGWYDHLEEVKKKVEKGGIGMVYGPNFSLGVALFSKILAEASHQFSKFPDYDVAGVEYHHKEKVDSPSGTALFLASLIDKNRKEKCQFSSVRSGHYPGTHTLTFDSIFDTITLTHTAKNRMGFAKGAIFAANWIYGKKGVYHFNEI